jgi:hypothetical protein
LGRGIDDGDRQGRDAVAVRAGRLESVLKIGRGHLEGRWAAARGWVNRTTQKRDFRGASSAPPRRCDARGSAAMVAGFEVRPAASPPPSASSPDTTAPSPPRAAPSSNLRLSAHRAPR